MYEGKVAMTIIDYDMERAKYLNFDIGTMIEKPDFSHFYRIDSAIGIYDKNVSGFEL